jgi:hypothetical protein
MVSPVWMRFILLSRINLYSASVFSFNIIALDSWTFDLHSSTSTNRTSYISNSDDFSFVCLESVYVQQVEKFLRNLIKYLRKPFKIVVKTEALPLTSGDTKRLPLSLLLASVTL